MSGSGRVFDVLLPKGGYLNYSAVEHGYEAAWLQTRVLPQEQGGVVTGPEDYALAVVGNRSYIFDGTSWSEPVTIAEGMTELDVVGNSDGGVSVLWTGPAGATYLSRHTRGGSWETIQVPNIPAGLLVRDVVLNDAGKTTVVWAAPSGEPPRSAARSCVRGPPPGPPRSRGHGRTTRAPNLTLATDGQGRETLIAGNQLFRQESASTPPRTSSARASGRRSLPATPATRVIWPVNTSGRYEIRTRYIETTWRPDSTTLWSRVGRRGTDCDRGSSSVSA